MPDQDELKPALPTEVFEHDLLNYAAQRRRQIGREIESKTDLPEIPPQALPASRSFSAPAWSALHD